MPKSGRRISPSSPAGARFPGRSTRRVRLSRLTALGILSPLALVHSACLSPHEEKQTASVAALDSVDGLIDVQTEQVHAEVWNQLVSTTIGEYFAAHPTLATTPQEGWWDEGKVHTKGLAIYGSLQPYFVGTNEADNPKRVRRYGLDQYDHPPAFLNGVASPDAYAIRDLLSAKFAVALTKAFPGTAKFDHLKNDPQAVHFNCLDPLPAPARPTCYFRPPLFPIEARYQTKLFVVSGSMGGPAAAAASQMTNLLATLYLSQVAIEKQRYASSLDKAKAEADAWTALRQSLGAYAGTTAALTTEMFAKLTTKARLVAASGTGGGVSFSFPLMPKSAKDFASFEQHPFVFVSSSTSVGAAAGPPASLGLSLLSIEDSKVKWDDPSTVASWLTGAGWGICANAFVYSACKVHSGPVGVPDLFDGKWGVMYGLTAPALGAAVSWGQTVPVCLNNVLAPGSAEKFNPDTGLCEPTCASSTDRCQPAPSGAGWLLPGGAPVVTKEQGETCASLEAVHQLKCETPKCASGVYDAADGLCKSSPVCVAAPIDTTTSMKTLADLEAMVGQTFYRDDYSYAGSFHTHQNPLATGTTNGKPWYTKYICNYDLGGYATRLECKIYSLTGGNHPVAVGPAHPGVPAGLPSFITVVYRRAAPGNECVWGNIGTTHPLWSQPGCTPQTYDARECTCQVPADPDDPICGLAGNPTCPNDGDSLSGTLCGHPPTHAELPMKTACDYAPPDANWAMGSGC
ncbi:MAG: hypothetical protein KC657_36385 [Myxococcales bacterium]|nr:hypothetical protein [Myxococcales bacterium]